MSERTIGRSLTEWELRYAGWSREAQPLREALTALGNGHFATRGAAEEARAEGPHYPGTYLAGGYDRLESEVGDRIIENEDLVNWPNWLPLTFRCQGGDWFHLERVDVLAYEQRLDLYRGVLARHVRFRDRAGRDFTLASRRIVDMADPRFGAIEWVLRPENWSGRIEIRSGIDGGVTNSGVDRYRAFGGRHLETLASGPTGEDGVYLEARARQSGIVMAQAVRTHLSVGGEPAVVERRTRVEGSWVAQHLVLACEARKPICVEKTLALSTSRDFAVSDPRTEACKQVHRAPAFAALLERHALAWKKLWRHADLRLVAESRYAQPVLRLHVFHMLQTASMNTIGRDVGIPARGLHGEAYRGHIFWDEIFTFPFLNLRIPELTRSLLLYRYRRLDEARHAAVEAGAEGAMFPWQSGSDGREESQVIHLNPDSGRWLPDETHRQRHVNGAIAYNVWQYFQATDDTEFLSFYGAEMLLDLARFWASLATYDATRERYVIRGVVGPDEFHTRYPGREEAGLDNNAYTNVMASWVLRTARRALALLSADRRAELLATLCISEADMAHWDEVSRRMFVPFHGRDGEEIISQFEGWDTLEELDWKNLKEAHGDIHRLDRVLEAEGDDPNRYKATKQADVLMLFFLFSAEELRDLFEHLGYAWDAGAIRRNVRYYLARTSHGSTLSCVVHAWVLARSDRRRSWHLFQDSLASDIDDVQGGTTPEGIHLGAMAGTVDLVQRCYTGIEMRDDVLWLNPCLPDGLDELDVALRYRGHGLALHITHDALTVSFENGRCAPVRVGFRGEVHEMRQGARLRFALDPECAGA